MAARMRRLRHIVFSSVAFFSVLLFLLFCTIWPVSHWRSLSLNLHMGSADPRHNFRTELDVQVLGGMISLQFSRDTLPAFLQQVQQRKLSGVEPREFDLNGQWSSSNWSLYPPAHQFMGIGGECVGGDLCTVRAGWRRRG